MNHQNGFLFVDDQSVGNLRSSLLSLSQSGGGLCIIASNVDKGLLLDEFPSNVRVLDFRYGGMSLLNTKHPRQEGFWTQYSHLDTGLAKNVIVSDTITDNTKIENWESKKHQIQLAPYGHKLTSEEYRHQHNHYQNLLCETFNFSQDLNAVSIWGDSGAFAPGAKSWGGFFSARSWPVKWDGYSPKDAINYENEDFDAAITGIEVDVLNNGKNWGDKSNLLKSSMAKVGVQIVGFGKRNTAAIEVRTEDSDDPSNTPLTRRGAWKWGMIVRNALHEDSTLIHCENGKIKRGVDLSRSNFTEGALLISSHGKRSGVVFGEGRGGEIYSDIDDTLVIKSGEKGLCFDFGEIGFVKICPNGGIEISEKMKEAILNALLHK